MDPFQNNMPATPGKQPLSLLSEEPLLSLGESKNWRGDASTYYHTPLVKKAHWSWEIILYFFFGGLAGGSFLISTLAHVPGSVQDRALVRAGRYLAFVSILISPVLLIKDLGRPARFHHMLRILKFRSVMSLGSWGISLFGLCCGIVTAHQMAEDHLLVWFPRLTRLLRVLPVKGVEGVGALAGLFVASYTGVLLSATAVPLWARARYILGPLFLTSGLSTALSALSLLLSWSRSHEETVQRLEQAEIVTLTAELGLNAVLPTLLRSLKQPLLTGKEGCWYIGGSMGAGLLVPLLLKLSCRFSGKASSRGITVITSLLIFGSGLLLRTSWIRAGRVSADTPEATHYYNALEQGRLR